MSEPQSQADERSRLDARPLGGSTLRVRDVHDADALFEDCTCEIGASGSGSSECSAGRYRDGVCCIKVDDDGSLVCRCTTTSTGASGCSRDEATIASCDLATVKSTYPKLETERCSQ
jgi:hypothetical protein